MAIHSKSSVRSLSVAMGLALASGCGPNLGGDDEDPTGEPSTSAMSASGSQSGTSGPSSNSGPGMTGSTSDGTASTDPDGGTVDPPKLDLAPLPDAPGSGTTTGELPEPECDNILPLPVPFVTISGPTSSEDFVLDADGYLLNVANGGDLLRAMYGAPSMLVFPGVGAGFASGTAMLSNGDVVFNGNNQVRRVASDGSVEILAAGLSYPNGLTVDMMDNVYVAENSGARVVRVDPVSLSVEVVADGLNNPNGLAFDRTYENLFIGSFGGGTVTRVNIASGAVDVYASNIGTGALDGVIVDDCDNVYVTDFGPGVVYRVLGTDHELVANLPSGWIPNMHFGSGFGGWDEGKLYVMDIGGNQLYELDLGVKGIPLPHL